MGIHLMPPLYKLVIEPRLSLYESNISPDNSSTIFIANFWSAQSFRPQKRHKITKVKLKMGIYSAGSPNPGTITISINAADINDYPTGADLCIGTTNGNTLPVNPNYEWREITLGAGAILEVGTPYVIVARASGADPNYVEWRMNTGGGYYTRGYVCYSVNSGGSWARPFPIDYDALFEEWGVPA